MLDRGPKKAVVWLDMNSCRVPDDVDPRCVRPIIEELLKFFTPAVEEVTIFAMGNLIRVPPLHIKAISSSGILMRNAHFDLRDIFGDLCRWKAFHPPPATIMIISQNPTAWEYFRRFKIHEAYGEGSYTLLPAYHDSLQGWETLITDVPDFDTISQMIAKSSRPRQCSVDSTEPLWSCSQCINHWNTYADFFKHLFGDDHLYDLKNASRKNIQSYKYFLKDRKKVSLQHFLQLDDPAPSEKDPAPSEKDASLASRKPSERNRRKKVKAKKKKEEERKKLDQKSLKQLELSIKDGAQEFHSSSSLAEARPPIAAGPSEFLEKDFKLDDLELVEMLDQMIMFPPDGNVPLTPNLVSIKDGAQEFHSSWPPNLVAAAGPSEFLEKDIKLVERNRKKKMTAKKKKEPSLLYQYQRKNKMKDQGPI